MMLTCMVSRYLSNDPRWGGGSWGCDGGGGRHSQLVVNGIYVQ